MAVYFKDHDIWSILSTSLLTVLFLWVAYIVVGMVDKFVITPMRIKRIMNRQGVKGPSSHLILGNLPEFTLLKKAETKKDMTTGDYNIVPHILPFHVRNCQTYGKTYLWWFGSEPRITITNLDLIKQVLPNKDHAFGTSQLQIRFSTAIIGKGLVTTDGEEWALRRQIVSPAFHHEKVKKVKDGGGNVELEVGDYMTHVTADIIARTAFGSNYEKGKKMFEEQVTLVDLMDQRDQQRFGAIPGYRFLSSHSCFQGHETTTTLLTRAMMLLGSHKIWQERAREEVMEVCGHGDHPIDANMLNKLKTLTMILNETLRLFPPISDQNKEATMDMKLGDLHIPKGLNLYFPRLAIHHDSELWGADVHEFKPERFVDGIAKASKNPFAFMPFSFGPQFCVGQGFALQEAKLVLVLVLQRFHFHLSPNYRHAPHDKVTLKPKYGVPMIVECL
ncbi:unnamed protein product [Sphagnum troendelagicum]|uniref:Cytochrome P450 n=1 Tax=Sphagnum troendelagicum TaxID=128251 RepID=A0ABP0TZ78_9BRYO